MKFLALLLSLPFCRLQTGLSIKACLVCRFQLLKQFQLLLFNSPQWFLNNSANEGLSVGTVISFTVPLIGHKNLLSNLPKKSQKQNKLETKVKFGMQIHEWMSNLPWQDPSLETGKCRFNWNACSCPCPSEGVEAALGLQLYEPLALSEIHELRHPKE